MRYFNIISLGKFISGEEIEMVIEAFAEFFHNQTSKHHKCLNLSIVDEKWNHADMISFAKNLKVDHVLNMVDIQDQEMVEKVYQEGSILMLPSLNQMKTIIPEAFSYSLPVVGLNVEKMYDYVDHTCGMLVDADTREDGVYSFMQALEILYFDPEAVKYMKKAALVKYEESFSWGKRQTA